MELKRLFAIFACFSAFSFSVSAEPFDVLNGEGLFYETQSLSENWIVNYEDETGNIVGNVSIENNDDYNYFLRMFSTNSGNESWYIQSKYPFSLENGYSYTIKAVFKQPANGAEMLVIDNTYYENVFLQTEIDDLSYNETIVHCDEDISVDLQFNAGQAVNSLEISSVKILRTPYNCDGSYTPYQDDDPNDAEDILEGKGEFADLGEIASSFGTYYKDDDEDVTYGNIGMADDGTKTFLRLESNGTIKSGDVDNIWKVQVSHEIKLEYGYEYWFDIETTGSTVYDDFIANVSSIPDYTWFFGFDQTYLHGGTAGIAYDNNYYASSHFSFCDGDYDYVNPAEPLGKTVNAVINVNAAFRKEPLDIVAMHIYKRKAWCYTEPTISGNQQFLFNQVGFRTSDFKEMAIVEGTDEPLEFLDESGEVTYTVTPTKTAKTWGSSGQKIMLVDFTDLKTAGTYTVRQGNVTSGKVLTIVDDPYSDLLNASLKFFYFQRASMDLEEEFAGKWARKAGHPDTQVKLHSSTGKTGTISSPKGWYDAGDYGKYIVNSGITTYTLLSLYEHYPEFFKNRKWNIPADGELPDLLAEIKYNLDWMLTMQDTDGGVFHKLTTLQFSGFVMPEKDVADRYAIGKVSTDAYSFAGVMAAAARIYKEFDETFAETCLNAAIKAYDWAKDNGGDYCFSNPLDVGTGEYQCAGGDNDFAAAELLITTNDNEKYSISSIYSYIPEWANISGIVTYEVLAHSVFTEDAHNDATSTIKAEADDLLKYANSGIGAPTVFFTWGSNSFVANNGIWLLHAYYATGDKKYYNGALKALDYLLGKNPMDMSYVTGMGIKSPMHPHHRPSQADTVVAPVPGMLVGGPHLGLDDVNTSVTNGDFGGGCSTNYSTGFVATTYLDNTCSYATNEVAINWNAPLAYLAGAIEALNNGFAPAFAHENVKEFARTFTSSSSSSSDESSSSESDESSSSENDESSSSESDESSSSESDKSSSSESDKSSSSESDKSSSSSSDESSSSESDESSSSESDKSSSSESDKSSSSESDESSSSSSDESSSSESDKSSSSESDKSSSSESDKSSSSESDESSSSESDESSSSESDKSSSSESDKSSSSESDKSSSSESDKSSSSESDKSSSSESDESSSSSKTEGITPSIAQFSGFRLTVSGRSVQIAGVAIGTKISVFDILGGHIGTYNANSANYIVALPRPGTYFVKIGKNIQKIQLK